ncbi:tripartite tricarboxylate transporter TctB family protein [Candidatus Pelagibacter sp. HIMB1483]|uniref:tripartite tricarboxylate transporter TctB family protein n=1 Tax=Candidatus Pelagibacter sp. HIMB1483 TaxID=3415414 RepID=UPI003F84F9F4
MRISATKFISLLFFIFSAFYLYTAHQIVVFTFDENAPFNARTFPIYLGWAGIFLSGLKIILPEKLKSDVNHKHLDYKSISYLILISIIYGAVILKIGYFVSTSLFLIASYYFLGERRWIWMFLLSFPFVAIFMFLLHGVLNIYLRDPLLKYLGIIG